MAKYVNMVFRCDHGLWQRPGLGPNDLKETIAVATDLINDCVGGEWSEPPENHVLEVLIAKTKVCLQKLQQGKVEDEDVT